MRFDKNKNCHIIILNSLTSNAKVNHRFQIKNSLILFYERTQLSYTQDADPHLSYQHQHLGKIIVRLAVSRN